MTEIQHPGAPREDEAAKAAALYEFGNAVFNGPVDLNEDGVGNSEENADLIAKAILRAHTTTWERDVDSAGNPVHRYVVRGRWAADPGPRWTPTRMPADPPQCAELTCPAFGSADFGAGTCPASHALAPVGGAALRKTIHAERALAVRDALSGVFARINMLVTTHDGAIPDALDAVREEASGWDVKL
jgi:hypothetical protein